MRLKETERETFSPQAWTVGMLCFALSVNQNMEDIEDEKLRTIKDDDGSGVVPLSGRRSGASMRSPKVRDIW